MIHVSNFRPLKRVAGDVVRVFARVRAGRAARLRLVGDGPERAAAEALARELGVAGDVELVGEHGDLPALLAGAAAFLLPSETESFGLAALEALAAGIPVVASRVGGLPEVVRDGEDGFAVTPSATSKPWPRRRPGRIVDHARWEAMSWAAVPPRRRPLAARAAVDQLRPSSAPAPAPSIVTLGNGAV